MNLKRSVLALVTVAGSCACPPCESAEGDAARDLSRAQIQRIEIQEWEDGYFPLKREIVVEPYGISVERPDGTGYIREFDSDDRWSSVLRVVRSQSLSEMAARVEQVRSAFMSEHRLRSPPSGYTRVLIEFQTGRVEGVFIWHFTRSIELGLDLFDRQLLELLRELGSELPLDEPLRYVVEVDAALARRGQ